MNDKYKFEDFPPSFVRCHNVSLKNGQYGTGPYTQMKPILESLMSCNYSHTPMKNQKNSTLDLYLFPFIDINPDLEFRVFVYNNKITAISQQNIYQSNFTLTPELCHQIYNIFCKFINEICRNNILLTEYTMDIAIVENKPYFIELNSFGKEYAAGSALFHWIIDEDILYGKKEVEFRYSN